MPLPGARGLDGPGAAKREDGSWADRREERKDIAHEWQLKQNERVAGALRLCGFDVFVPHEWCDPLTNKSVAPAEVDMGDRSAVAGADLLVLLADYPAVGAGKESLLSENFLEATITLSSSDTHVSRLVSGTPHRYREDTADHAQWPFAAVSLVLDDVVAHCYHAEMRKQNVEEAARRLSQFPPEAVSTSRFLTPARAAQLRADPGQLMGASFIEFQELCRVHGLEVKINIRPAAQVQHAPVLPTAASTWNVDAIAEHLLTTTPGLHADAPNSATALRRSLGVGAPHVNDTLKGPGRTVRNRDHSFRIELRSSGPHRDAFTIAHELAHIQLEGEALVESDRYGPDVEKLQPLEIAADALAGRLFRPTAWVDQQWRRAVNDDPEEPLIKIVERLARRSPPRSTASPSARPTSAKTRPSASISGGRQTTHPWRPVHRPLKAAHDGEQSGPVGAEYTL